ncbi:MAG: hypothetical protein R3192_07025 [Woeseiaceae bacterium]|nr:hypothetical protein [Woeseiaceae bacterium]
MLYQLIEISGNDAEEFLQGQLTQDVARLAEAISLPAAWCNAKGRVIATIRLLRLGDAIGLAVSPSLADVIMQRLAMYRLRADVNIAAANANWTSAAVSSNEALAELERVGLLPAANSACAAAGLIAVDVSVADRYVEIFGNRDAFEKAGISFEHSLSDAEHAALRIRAGHVEINAENSEKYTPHMLNLDQIGAISFEKGCYTGQEVVARTEHRGESKRRLARYRCDAGDVAIGDRLCDDEREVATVVNVQRPELLAVTPVALHGKSLRFRDVSAIPLK